MNAPGGKRRIHLSRGAVSQLTDALLSLDEVAAAASREQIIALMDPRIATAVPSRDSARAHVVEWLRTCESFDGGRADLIAALQVAIADTAARARLFNLIDQLWPDQ